MAVGAYDQAKISPANILLGATRCPAEWPTPMGAAGHTTGQQPVAKN